MKRGASSRLTGTTSLGFLVLTCLSACGSTEPQTSPGGAGTGGVGGQAGGTGGVMSGGSAGTGGSAGGSGGTSGAGGAGGTSGAGGSAGSSSVTTCSKPSDAGPLTTRLPCLLSETGLYEADMVTLSAGVHTYAPSFQLWSDAAEKKRWISLPADTQIDTTDMDFWEFPAGTKLWKEFARDGVRVETRLIQKQPSGSWYAVAYHWRSDQMEADAVPNGVQNASSTPHDIPDNEACMKCHSQQPDKVLGFSAIQLSHATVNAADPREWTLSTLVADDVLTAPPAQAFTVPGTQTEKDFFGYLHANCGHCHNPTGSGNSQTGLDMWLKVADLAGPVTEFSVYKALYDVDIVWLDGAHPAGTKRVVPGNFADSAIYQRLMTKGEEWSMPPLATEEVDPTAKQIFETWIGSLAQP